MTTNIFDRINDWIRDAEGSLVNLLSAIAPWGAPLAPAYMSFRGMQLHLGYTPFVALVVAAVIEILGLATVHTTLVFWKHNRRYSKEDNKMPTTLAGGMFALYLVIILTVNIALEWPVKWVYTPILARALLSLLAVPASITLAVRALHTELLHDMQRKRVQPTATNPQPVAQPVALQATMSNRERVLELHHAQPGATQESIAQAVGISRQQVSKYIKANGFSHHEEVSR